ncbi:GNAT family N-acetyltransferase [Stappia sp. GBMRC 2046]|uniref:GNAT family N-acetyltransferase n=1 Tax=Stappia sediminis TaxID=2692190 RepID=A0A7X3LR48_9HYPH|nr:GNAT family N-acetyltransferase [Stappia sediminis]MXN63564.1 GNAT family N-acetyltransferase [Stappia sediminis]
METPTIFETERLRVLGFSMSDLPLLKALHSDPEVNRHLVPGDEIQSDAEAAERLDNFIHKQERFGFGQWKVETLDGEFVGRAGFLVFEQTSEIALSICLGTKHWGQGYASELAPKLIDWFFENTYYTHLIAFVLAGNEPSRHVMEKAGFTCTKRVLIDGRPYDRLQVLAPAIARRYPMTA